LDVFLWEELAEDPTEEMACLSSRQGVIGDWRLGRLTAGLAKLAGDWRRPDGQGDVRAGDGKERPGEFRDIPGDANDIPACPIEKS